MRNKFEALKAFIDWPEDWQRLCMLVWAESDNAPTAEQSMQAEPVRDCIDTGEMKLKGIPSIGDPFPHDRTRAVRRAAKVQPMKPWSMADDEALVKLHDTGIRRSQIIMRFMTDHPYRTFNAVASRHDHLRRLDWKVQ